MAAISLESIDLCTCSICSDSILFEEKLKSNEVSAKEVNIAEDRTIIKCVSRLSASSAGSTGVKVFVGCQRIDTAVAQSFEMIKPSRHRDIVWVVPVK